MQEEGLSFAKQDFKPGKVPARDPSDRDLPHDLCAGLRLQIQNLSGDLEKLKIQEKPYSSLDEDPLSLDFY